MSSKVDAASGYRTGATLSFRAEFGRQFARRRTQIALGFQALLPIILLAAFYIGESDSDGGNGRAFVDVATSSGANFAFFTLFASSSFLLTVIVALFCGDTVASEASWGSLRYLLAAPVPRARLLRQKLLVALAYSGLALVILVGVALIVGTLAYGWNPVQTPLGDRLTANEAMVRLPIALGYIAVTLLKVGALAFLLSVSVDAPLGAVGGAVMVTIVSGVLAVIDALGDLRALLPTWYDSAWVDAFATPIHTDSMAKGALSSLVYTTLFLALAWWRFTRKDIVS